MCYTDSIMEKDVLGLFIQKELIKIKSDLADNVGHKVKLTAKKGRKQYVTRQGVIENTYPSIFTVKLDTPDDLLAAESFLQLCRCADQNCRADYL